MIEKIKNKIEKSLKSFARSIDKRYGLQVISPIVPKNIAEFILRPGKRIRPILFVIGYLGFSKKPAAGLYTSALSFELLHDFMLVHDDIIDKSDLRRGRPSMHAMLKKYIAHDQRVKFNGQDLAIVIGDVIYAISIDAMLKIRENYQRKEKALKQLIRATIYTGSGEFIELLCGGKKLNATTKEVIYKIYDYKTAYYTFSCPLSTGAILAGASPKEINTISRYGIYLGRAFQIKDDILGMFSQEQETGKSTLSDLQEAKKTLLIWYAYNHSARKLKAEIQRIYNKRIVNISDLKIMRRLIISSGALEFARKEITVLANKASGLIKSSRMKKTYRDFLYHYSQQILSL
ncbi:polyprenyl synthetase family protein [bacterium]|nr:MAG: polyprenyl synthetase family protein [bacterium]